MEKQIAYGSDYKYIPTTSIASGMGQEILPDIYCYTIQIVNVVFVGHPNNKDFVLIDAGMPYSGEKIIAETEERFGKGARPKAILLTHGHFDHVGGIVQLLHQWDIPVFAHEKELPYLTGEQNYPTPDATVEGGFIAKISPFFPIEPIQLGSYVHPLPKDGTVPFLQDFRWIQTPGHSPGHVSFFRDHDRMLIVGDAFVSVRQDSLYKVLTQKQEIHGPPRYLTTDWNAAWQSVQSLAELKPNVAITGHGFPLQGQHLKESLDYLVKHFAEIAIPSYGKYVH